MIIRAIVMKRKKIFRNLGIQLLSIFYLISHKQGYESYP